MRSAPSSVGSLEGFAAHDEPDPPARLLITAVRTAWDRSSEPLGLAARVDEGDPPRIAVDHLPAGEVDGMVGRELAVDQGSVFPT